MKCIPILVILLCAVYFVLLMKVNDSLGYAGQRCNWSSECGFGEVCAQLDFHERDGSSYLGICVPGD